MTNIKTKKEIPVSTLRMVTEKVPSFPLGKVCGIYQTYPKQETDWEGGLRLQGKYKESTDEYPLITYITVVYNRVNTIKDCMASVWMQTWPNVEYIIVDGSSTDGTRELLQDNQDKIDYFISQKDLGIYDAMNKGISLASGKYICFMNSDDVCVPMAAEKVGQQALLTHADLICGSRELWQNGAPQIEHTYMRFPIKNCVFRYMQMYHQATYASHEAFEKAGYFDKTYRLLADWIWESRCIDLDLKVFFFDEVLTRFHYDGASYLGMETRDHDWILWIQNTFPEISYKDAETLLFMLDQYRSPYFEIHTLLPLIKKYDNNPNFLTCIYQTLLLRIIDTTCDMLLLSKEFLLSFSWDFSKKEKIHGKYRGYKNLLEITEHFILELENSCCTSRSTIQYKDIQELSSVRQSQNHMYDRLTMKQYFGKETCSYVTRVIYAPYYVIEKMATYSLFLSRELFRKKRDRMIQKARMDMS